MIFESPLEWNGEAVEQSVYEYVFQEAHRHAEKKALIYAPTGQSYTFRELQSHCDKLAEVLWEKGVRPGDRVCLMLCECIEYVVIFLALVKIGAIYVPMVPCSSSDDLIRVLKETEASCMFADDETILNVKEANKTHELKHIFTVGKVGGFEDYESLLLAESTALPNEIAIDLQEDTAFIMFSSGTTGTPKAIMQCQNALVMCAKALSHPEVTLHHSSQDDVLLTIFPMFASAGFLQVVASLSKGSAVVLRRFKTDPVQDPVEDIECINRYKVTVMYTSPSFANDIGTYILEKQLCETPTVRVCMATASKLPKDVIDTIAKGLQCPDMRGGFGITELFAVILHRRGNFVDGSTGALLPGCKAKIVDIKTGQILGPNQSGELYLKVPWAFKCYMNQPDLTKKVLDEEGWFHSGDIALIDEDDNVFICGRLKEMLKVKGKTVLPLDIESLLKQHPAIAEAAVVAAPTSGMDDKPQAFVMLHKGLHVTDVEICKYVAEQTPWYNHLTGGVILMDSLPIGAHGRVIKSKLREWYEQA